MVSRSTLMTILLLLIPVALPGQQTASGGKEPAPEFRWERYARNPVFPATPGTWREGQTANPDLMLIDDTYYMYFRGQQGGHDRIGLATIPRDRFDGATWEIKGHPIVDVGEPGSWDEEHCLDPATVRVNGQVFLYYSAVSPRASRSICLAVSKDGVHFTKYGKNPVVIGGGPEVVYHDRTFYLFFWDRVPGRKGFQIHLATSKDGYHFSKPSLTPVLAVGPEGSWDSFTVETPRIFFEGGLFYMVYCGSDRYSDYPWNAGLATSHDLVHWTKYEGNPIFSRGEPGAWDEGAIWFTTVEKINGRYYMWYEGYGGGNARNEPYADYLTEGRSQVGMATLDAPYFYVQPGPGK